MKGLKQISENDILLLIKQLDALLEERNEEKYNYKETAA
jgi:hypothetical protein